MTIPRQHLPAIGTAAALLLAWVPMPYGYYQLLRIAVTACAIWMLLSSDGWNSLPKWSKYTLLSIAVLFNPLLPIHLDRALWAVIDPITAGILLFISIRVTGAQQ
jgi:hypothetical protein